MNNNIEPTSLGWASEPQPKKSKTWIRIVLAVLVLCLCLAVLGVGLYYFLTIRSSEVSTDSPGGGDYPSAPTFAPLATMFPSPTERISLPTSLVVELFIPGDDYDYSLYELVSMYEGSTEPGVKEWDVSLSAYDSVVIEQGWCTTSAEILEQNFEHIEITFDVDGERVDPGSLYMNDYVDEDKYCRSYLGIIQAWPVGNHVIIIEMVLDEPINDGWNDYVAGPYIDQFIISATP